METEKLSENLSNEAQVPEQKEKLKLWDEVEKEAKVSQGELIDELNSLTIPGFSHKTLRPIEDKQEDCFHQCTSNCRKVGCNCECGEYHDHD